MYRPQRPWVYLSFRGSKVVETNPVGFYNILILDYGRQLVNMWKNDNPFIRPLRMAAKGSREEETRPFKRQFSSH